VLLRRERAGDGSHDDERGVVHELRQDEGSAARGDEERDRTNADARGRFDRRCGDV
jgi:hypothetical protein